MKALQEKRISLRSLWRRSLVILSLIALAFASCGDSDSGDPSTPVIPIEPTRLIVGMELIDPPAEFNVAVYEGMPVNLAGIRVIARYADGQYEYLTNPNLFICDRADHVWGPVGSPQRTYTIRYRYDFNWSVNITLPNATTFFELERMHVTKNLIDRTYYSDDIPNFAGIELELRYKNTIERMTRILPPDYKHWRFSHIDEPQYGHFLAIAIQVGGDRVDGVHGRRWSEGVVWFDPDEPYTIPAPGAQHVNFVRRDPNVPGGQPLIPGDQALIADANVVYLTLDEVIHITGITLNDPTFVVEIFADDERIRPPYGDVNRFGVWEEFPGFLRPYEFGAANRLGGTNRYGEDVNPQDDIVRYSWETLAARAWMDEFKELSFTVTYGNGHESRSITMHEAMVNRHPMDILWDYFPENVVGVGPLNRTDWGLADRGRTHMSFRYRGYKVDVPIMVYTRLSDLRVEPAPPEVLPIVIDGTNAWVDNPTGSQHGQVASKIVVTATFQAASDTAITKERVIPFAAADLTKPDPVNWAVNHTQPRFYNFSDWDNVVITANNNRERQLRLIYRFVPTSPNPVRLNGVPLFNGARPRGELATARERNVRLPVFIQNF